MNTELMKVVQQGAMLQVVAARTVYDLIEIVHFFNL